MSKGLDAWTHSEYISMMYCITTNRLYEFLVLFVIDFNILFSPLLPPLLLLSAESVDVYRTQACMTQWNVNAWKRIWMRLNKTRERETRSINEIERILLNEAAAEAADVIKIKER